MWKPKINNLEKDNQKLRERIAYLEGAIEMLKNK